jgi:hypothetical protein
LRPSSSVHLPVRRFARGMLGFKASCHLSRHCFFVRPGTSAVIAAQFLPPCVCTESFSLMSSSSVHVPARLVAPSMLGSRASSPFRRHCLSIRSTWDQLDNCDPILVTVRLYRILYLDDFVFFPLTRMSSRPVDARIRGIMPSVPTMLSRSTWDQRRNSDPILVTVP